MSVENKMRFPIESDARGFRAVVDEAPDGSKAIPVTFVYKTGNGFEHDGGPGEGGPENKMKKPIETDPYGQTKVVDEDINGVKAIPLVVVKKNEDGEFEYADLGGGEVAPHTHEISEINGLQSALNGKANTSHTHTIAQISDLQDALDEKADASHTHEIADVNGLQSALEGKADASHTHNISQISGLQSALDAKLTATQAEAQADSEAADLETLVADFNALLAKLRAAGIMAE